MLVALSSRTPVLTIAFLAGLLVMNASGQPTTDSVDQLSVLSYNVFGRPFIVSHDGQVERSCRIPGEIYSQIANSSPIDVIVVQEAFTQGCRDGADLRTLLSHFGWPYSTRTVGEEAGRLANGGVFIASRWPIVASAEEVYTECKGADCLAAKGVVYARVLKTAGGEARHFSVFGTHLNAGRGEAEAKVRLEQATQLARFTARQDIPASEAVLVAGDLNVDNLSGTAEVEAVLAILGARIPEIRGSTRTTADAWKNPLREGSDSKWIDYVLYVSEHARPNRATLEAIPLRTASPFDICMSAPLRPDYVYPDSSWCQKTLALSSLSDHYPVLGRFSYPSPAIKPESRREE